MIKCENFIQNNILNEKRNIWGDTRDPNAIMGKRSGYIPNFRYNDLEVNLSFVVMVNF